MLAVVALLAFAAQRLINAPTMHVTKADAAMATDPPEPADYTVTSTTVPDEQWDGRTWLGMAPLAGAPETIETTDTFTIDSTGQHRTCITRGRHIVGDLHWPAGSLHTKAKDSWCFNPNTKRITWHAPAKFRCWTHGDYVGGWSCTGWSRGNSYYMHQGGTFMWHASAHWKQCLSFAVGEVCHRHATWDEGFYIHAWRSPATSIWVVS